LHGVENGIFNAELADAPNPAMAPPLTIENQQRRVVDPAVGHSLMRKYLLARFVYGATCIVLLALASFELFFSLSSSKTNWLVLGDFSISRNSCRFSLVALERDGGAKRKGTHVNKLSAPNQTRQPTPEARLGCNSASLARRGCAAR
jgi:hypothetical protein